MGFIEAAVFTKAIDDLLDAEEFRVLQLALLARPNLGAVIPGTVRLRKMRWSRPGSGKRGGMRVIYYWDMLSDTFYLLYVYPKSARDDLTPKQLRVLSRLVREEFQ
jgi:hypothetical protein